MARSASHRWPRLNSIDAVAFCQSDTTESSYVLPLMSTEPKDIPSPLTWGMLVRPTQP